VSDTFASGNRTPGSRFYSDLFTSSWVATVFVTSHAYRIYWGFLIYPYLCRHLNCDILEDAYHGTFKWD